MTEMLQRLTPDEVREGLADETILLIDVREPLEFAESRIPGALLFPLSTFDARLLPEPADRRLVFLCSAGNRSQRAFNQARAAGLSVYGHLEGGITAWIAAGNEIARTDPATGKSVLVKPS